VYLVDTNVWLERLLEQERTEEVKRFLDSVSSDQLSITDFFSTPSEWCCIA